MVKLVIKNYIVKNPNEKTWSLAKFDDNSWGCSCPNLGHKNFQCSHIKEMQLKEKDSNFQCKNIIWEMQLKDNKWVPSKKV
jgi:hypothetical protein